MLLCETPPGQKNERDGEAGAKGEVVASFWLAGQCCMRLSSGKSSIRELEFIAKKKKPERDRQAQNMTALYIASYSGLSICRYTLLCWAWTRRLQRIIGRYLSRSSLPQSSAWHEEETAWRFFFSSFFFLIVIPRQDTRAAVQVCLTRALTRQTNLNDARRRNQ